MFCVSYKKEQEITILNVHGPFKKNWRVIRNITCTNYMGVAVNPRMRYLRKKLEKGFYSNRFGVKEC